MLRGEDGATQSLRVDRVILAVGITGNVEDLGLEGTGVRVERGHIVVNEWLETDEPGVHAIGDVVGPPWLAHKASHEGVVCVERIAGFAGAHPLDASQIPGCTYCRPQIASVGLSERARAGARPRGSGGALPVPRQRQGARAGRVRGLREDGLRRAQRRAARRPHDRKRGHRADPGLRHRAQRSRRPRRS